MPNKRTTSPNPRRPPRSRNGSAAAAAAAAKAVQAHGTSISILEMGTMQLPSKGTLAYFVGIGALAAFGILEWPVAAVVGIGHLLAQQRGNAVLEEFGQGLSDA